MSELNILSAVERVTHSLQDNLARSCLFSAQSHARLVESAHSWWPDKFVFVECDGHDFHERTKEQAERDRSKDRAIQSAGIPILRFTGREIWRDPVMVALEIFNFILSRGRDGT